MNNLPALTASLVAWVCTAAVAAAQSASASPPAQFPNRPVPDFNVALNDDSDWTFTSDDPQESLRDLRVAVDGLAGTAVKTYVRCVALGSDVLYYPTKAGSMIGWRLSPGDKRNEIVTRAKRNLEAGIDPLRIVGERAKQIGLYYFPSYRMNDAHFVSTADTGPIVGEFYVRNRDKLTMPNKRLDFSHAEVREYRLGIILEVLDRYQDTIDGIELDFNRHALYFPTGTGWDKRDLLTGMVAKVRQRLAELEQKNGRPYYLMVRVSPTLANSRYSGLDVAEWIKRRLVDVVIPAQVYSISHDLPISDLIELAHQSGCKVYPAIYERTQYTWPFVREPSEKDYSADGKSVPTVELFAGAAANYFAMGADGFELFNIRAPLGVVGVQAARVFSSPAAFTARNRTYTITAAHGSDLRKAGVNPADDKIFQYLKPIPADVKPGSGLSLNLLVGDNLNAPAVPSPAYAAVRLGLIGAEAKTKIRLSLNGSMLHDGPVESLLTQVTGGPKEIHRVFAPLPQHFLQVPIQDTRLIRPGQNELQVELPESGDAKVTIVEVQLGVLYDDPFPKRI